MTSHRLVRLAGLRPCLALSAWVLLTAPAVAAPIASASASVSDLTYRLIDLDSGDGISPSATFSGGGRVNARTMTPYSAYFGGYDTVEFADTAITGVPFLPGVSLGTAGNLATMAGRGAQASSTIQSLNPELVSSIDNAREKAFSYRINDGSQQDTALSVWDPEIGDQNVKIHLSPNTAIVFNGAAQANLSLSPQAADEAFRSLIAQTGLTPNQAYRYDSYFGSGGLGARAGVHASLNFTEELFDADGQRIGQTFRSSSVDISLDRSVMPAYVNHMEEAGFLDADVLQSATKSFQIDFANLTGQSVDLTFNMNVWSATALVSSLEVQESFAVIDPPPIEPPPIAFVPEPGTYALMGLGLVGLLLARRRHALRT